MPGVSSYFDACYRREASRTDATFGIRDDGRLAFTTPETAGADVAVKNPARRDVQFTPVDHNIIVWNDRGEEQSQCDGMLYVKETEELVFVEIKDQQKKWIPEAEEQLESTIAHFRTLHDTTAFRHRSAYAANRQHPHFNYSQKDRCIAFRNRTGFRLNIVNRIALK